MRGARGARPGCTFARDLLPQYFGGAVGDALQKSGATWGATAGQVAGSVLSGVTSQLTRIAFEGGRLNWQAVAADALSTALFASRGNQTTATTKTSSNPYSPFNSYADNRGVTDVPIVVVTEPVEVVAKRPTTFEVEPLLFNAGDIVLRYANQAESQPQAPMVNVNVPQTVPQALGWAARDNVAARRRDDEPRFRCVCEQHERLALPHEPQGDALSRRWKTGG